MDVVVVLIVFSLIVAVGFLIAFIWALRNGQFDDLVTPSIRMLFDNKKDEKLKTKKLESFNGN
ncbi:MAG: cbb3-type cytochrome oxidase assembly protein CcoS [candidate division Zixibacteria bacterium]|nr:cbb3-type cytochrome oxidase assembly protein CcoS [candidate division Zixibacteria bacterium]